MQSAIGSMPKAHRQTKGEVGRSESSNLTITERYVANIIKRKILGKKKAK
jgi:hypothetical protein